MSHAIKLLLLILMSVVTTQLLSGHSYLDVVGISRLQYFWSSNTSTLLSWSLCLQFPCLACASHIQLLIIQIQPKCHLNLFPTSRVCLAGPPWTFTQSELSSTANAMKPSITDLYRQWPALSTLTLRITVNNAYELALPLHQHGYLVIFCTFLQLKVSLMPSLQRKK